MILDTLTRPLFSLARRMLDDAVPEDTLRAYLVENINRLLENDLDKWSPPDILGLHQCYLLLQMLNLPTPAWPERIPPPPNPPDEHALDAWIETLPNGFGLTRQKLLPGSGEMMINMLAHYPAKYENFLADNLERLLRHVEVKRKDCLPLTETGKNISAATEKNNISILFSQYTHSTGDARFLNAALKLNDWAFGTRKQLNTSEQIRYLLALAEAEAALAGLR